MLATLPELEKYRFPALKRTALRILQVNLGYRCNQQCQHCHVNAGPNRAEMMDEATIDAVLEVISNQQIQTLDITGGAPELHERFQYLVMEARKCGASVIDRCNLTILSEPGQEGLASFLAENQVEIVASLPCYLEENVDAQRGRGSYIRSIAGLKELNRFGYGVAGTGLVLNLVYNPQSASLPPEQQALESDYRQKLAEQHGIVFSSLFTLANMPIQRFGSMLLSKGMFDDYMQLLQSSHLESNLDAVMCRGLVSVDWQGFLYDCDFNQMLEMAITDPAGNRRHISELNHINLTGTEIKVAGHCFGCTAGQGSSCGGALS